MGIASVKHFSLGGAIATAAAFAVCDVWLRSRMHAPDEAAFRMFHFAMAVLLATWVVADTREGRRPAPSFDYGWFILLTFPVYSAYYLITTRRWLWGLLMIAGALLLFMLPSLAEEGASYVR
jgi:hypothetical protein